MIHSPTNHSNSLSFSLLTCSFMATTATLTLSPILSHNHQFHHHVNPSTFLPITRRSLLFLSTTTTTLPSISSPSPPSPSPPPTLPPPPSPPSLPKLDTTITDLIFMDFALCPTFIRSDRTLSESDLTTCPDSYPLGRLILGLYGNLVPITVANFKAMCTGPYKGTLVDKIFPGQFFLAGRQSRRAGDKGEVRPPLNLARNIETVDSRAFILRHSKAGVVSLCLSENDDDEDVMLDPNYRNVEFLITTGPGPCPQLDNKNIVFGTVVEGLDVVTAIASIPTYKPAEKIRQLNDLAGYFGDERAQNARATWNKPLKAVYISDCGEVKKPKSVLSPSLP